MFGRLGGTELFIILVVGFLIFGSKKLPEIGKTFGDTIREFKKSSKDDVKEFVKKEESKNANEN
ncbi:twin-arginine translocase TatA/TatE family subunit [Oceanirhabdus seepicola]|uniref:Sec-independent protein translocase protein TatA n=1 Tax=Oceanirhabdus seepicola TaxID=2828781 RepID=A0A9J6P4W6_9CLOT|nr:twin-arginine translocase TatA/TatE family subunit [Oceanirhabdus seepicola]MCM1991759.1 twin-arginine translocase TatA/TatE family subunit [Oceanirhabdus seepicola]